MNHNYNWVEIELFAQKLHQLIQNEAGLQVDRIFIPYRSFHPQHFFKNEWAFRLSSKKTSGLLVIHLQSQSLFLSWYRDLKNNPQATLSSFGISLQKNLVGSYLQQIQATPGELVVTLHFNHQVKLVLTLIPSKMNATLLNPDDTVIASLRPLQDLNTPSHTGAPQVNFEVRPSLQALSSLSPFEFFNRYSQSVDQDLDLEFKTQHLRQKLQILKQDIQSLKTKSKQLDITLKQIEHEPHWFQLGQQIQAELWDLDLWKTRLQPDASPQLLQQFPQWQTQLTPAENMHRYFERHKRSSRKKEDTISRLQGINQKLEQSQKLYLDLQTPEGEARFHQNHKEQEERQGTTANQHGSSSQKPPFVSPVGKTFYSKEKLTLIAGRNKTENLELTFKIARGNDLWFHVKGKPGSHVIILLRDKKNASLESLLDAAHLCIYYSGGEKWGKTEVDYTQKKHVKKIKGSDEVSYTHTKTLMIDYQPSRVSNLLASVLNP
jgi:predicted ribosome quality control (RQC) complex YloA/Tae2 family protein